LLGRSAQCNGQFVGVGIKCAIAQIFDYLSGLSLIGPFIVNLLVEHRKAPCSVLFQITYAVVTKNGK